MADPVASLVSPDMYRDMVLPRHKRIFEHMKEADIIGRLHMCGNTTAILPYSSQCGAVILDIDHAVDFNKALETVRDRCIVNGNIDPAADVYKCDAAHTKQAMLECARQIGGKRAMFMPGCELPTDTPIENIRAIADALKIIGG